MKVTSVVLPTPANAKPGEGLVFIDRCGSTRAAIMSYCGGSPTVIYLSPYIGWDYWTTVKDGARAPRPGESVTLSA